MPTGTSAGMVTLNFVIGGGLGAGCFGFGFGAGFLGSGFGGGGGGGMIGSSLLPGWLNRRVCGSSRSVPAKVSSTVVPALAPHGVSTSKRGLGKLLSAGGWARDEAGCAKNAYTIIVAVSNPNPHPVNETPFRMTSPLSIQHFKSGINS